MEELSELTELIATWRSSLFLERPRGKQTNDSAGWMLGYIWTSVYYWWYQNYGFDYSIKYIILAITTSSSLYLNIDWIFNLTFLSFRSEFIDWFPLSPLRKTERGICILHSTNHIETLSRARPTKELRIILTPFLFSPFSPPFDPSISFGVHYCGPQNVWSLCPFFQISWVFPGRILLPPKSWQL